MSDDEDIAALVIDNVSGMMKGEFGFTEWRERGKSKFNLQRGKRAFCSFARELHRIAFSPCLCFQ
jgi:hypothetical protein